MGGARSSQGWDKHTGRREKGSEMGRLPSACLDVAHMEVEVFEDADEDGEMGQAPKQATVRGSRTEESSQQEVAVPPP